LNGLLAKPEILRSNMTESAGMLDSVGVTFTFTCITLAERLVTVVHSVFGSGAAVDVVQVVPAASELNGMASYRPISAAMSAVR